MFYLLNLLFILYMDSKQEMKNAVPVRHWGLDPLYWAHIKLFVKDVLELNNYPGFKGIYIY